MWSIEDRIKQTKEGKAFRGKNELIKHYRGKRITMSEAIKAKCYDCCGGYDDGASDCEVVDCPLHPYAPYSANKAPKKLLTEETKVKMRERAKTSDFGRSRKA